MAPDRPRRWPGRLLGLMLVLQLAALVVAGHRLQTFVTDLPLPSVPNVDLVAAFFDVRPIRITTTIAWKQMPAVVEVHQLRTDPTVWRRMFFRDWDRLPADLRDSGIAALLDRYSLLLATRTAGATLVAADWDWVPQPVRAMAFVNMIEHWVAVERPGEAYGLDPDLVRRTLKAICMTESWFEHRAVHANGDDSRDLGLAQASDYARTITRRWGESGAWPLTLDDDDYFNPWFATRWIVLWFEQMLAESGGDLDRAIRAYNVGAPRAVTEGAAYHDVVLSRRSRYFEGPSGSPSWAALSASRLERLARGLAAQGGSDPIRDPSPPPRAGVASQR